MSPPTVIKPHWSGLKNKVRPHSPSSRKKYVDEFVKLVDGSEPAQQMMFRRMKRDGTKQKLDGSDEEDSEEHHDTTFKLTSAAVKAKPFVNETSFANRVR